MISETLPNFFIERTIEEMKEGEIGYIEPQFLMIDEDKKGFVSPYTFVWPQRDNNHTLTIYRKEDHYFVSILGVAYRWSFTAYHHYLDRCLPVIFEI